MTNDSAGSSWKLRFKEGTLKSVSAINILGIVNSPPVKVKRVNDVFFISFSFFSYLGSTYHVDIIVSNINIKLFLLNLYVFL